MIKIFPWFQANLEKLAQAFNNNRFPHALLFVAPNGCGKLSFAMDLVRSILCTNSRVDLQLACGQCKSCLLMKAKTHPDFYSIECLLDNKGKQKKSIGIDQIRHLNAKLTETSQLAGWRIALITSVSSMTTASFNALLKTLEEPGDRTLLILLADNLQKVPATIRSRCQILQPKLKTEILSEWLLSQTQCDKLAVLKAIKSNFNAPLKALEYLQNDGEKQEISFYQLCDQVLLNKISPQELLKQTQVELDVIWQSMSHYFNQVEVARQKKQGLNQYQQLPSQLTLQLFDKLIAYNRAQFMGSNLQAKVQLLNILILWFEAGRKIKAMNG